MVGAGRDFNFFNVFKIVDAQNQQFGEAQPLFFHTNSVKCFSVYRVYRNIGFSVYVRH